MFILVVSELNVKIHIDFYHEVENHDGKKPYKCLKYEFTFLQKEELSTHITSVHEIEKPYKFSKCDFSFLQKEKLSKHITSVQEIL